MRRLIESRIGILLMALALVFVLGSIASACPTCSEALEKQDPSHGGIVKGYFYSILFMMGTPYLIFGTFCGAMYYQVRRARRAAQPKPSLAGAAQPTARIPVDGDRVLRPGPRSNTPSHAESAGSSSSA